MHTARVPNTPANGWSSLSPTAISGSSARSCCAKWYKRSIRSFCSSETLASVCTLETSLVMTSEVTRKEINATTFRGLVTAKENSGVTKKKSRHPTARTDTTAEETKSPVNDCVTTASRYKGLAV